jgi:signal peptidase II
MIPMGQIIDLGPQALRRPPSRRPGTAISCRTRAIRYKADVPRKYVILLAVALSVIVLDQWTKYLVLRDLTSAFAGQETLGARLSTMFSEAPPLSYDGLHYRQTPSVTLSEKFFRLRYAENPGAAWGLFRNLPEKVRGPLFHLISLGAVILIGHYFRKLSGDPAERWALWGLPFVLGGALGNYIDRLARGASGCSWWTRPFGARSPRRTRPPTRAKERA